MDAGWGIAAVSDDNLVQILCGPVICDPRHPAFSGAAVELTGFAEAIRWVNFSSPGGERVRILHDSKHAARVALGVAHARRNIILASICNDSVLRSKDKFYISIHHVFGHAGNECADIAASFGTRGFISQCNAPTFSATHPHFVLVEPVQCCCTVGHITACYSRHDSDILLTLRRLGPQSDHEKLARIIHCAQRT